MKLSPKPPRQKRPKKMEMETSDELGTDSIKVESLTPSVIRKTKLEHMEIEIQSPNTAAVDGQHFIIDDNITVESNIEIEFITSDDLLPGDGMEADGMEYDNSDADKKYGDTFVDEISSQQEEMDGCDGLDDTWENVKMTMSYLSGSNEENFCFFAGRLC